MRPQALFLGGRSGVGKSSAAFALHDLLAARDIGHAVIEGDALDLAHPWPSGLAERNLAAMWAEYRALGYSRLVFTNTVSVLETAALAAAMGDDPVVTAVLLRASDAFASERLARRESGESLDRHVARSRAAAVRLDAEAGSEVHRLDTDRLTPAEVAERLLALTGW